jgi:hypothetical protein
MKDFGETLQTFKELHPESEGLATSKTFTILCHEGAYVGITDEDGRVEIPSIPLGRAEVRLFEWSSLIVSFKINGAVVPSTTGTIPIDVDGAVDLGTVVAVLRAE